MSNEKQGERPLLQLPGLESRVLPGGTEIHAKPGELEFVARIVGMGIRLNPVSTGEAQNMVQELKENG